MSPALDDCLQRLEQAWQHGPPPDLAEFWKTIATCAPPDERSAWLLEIVKVDLEYRWSKRDGTLGRLDDYAGLFPELGPAAEWPLDLIGEEWRARQRWGDRPAVAEYLWRFPGRVGLEAHLLDSQREIQREWHEPPAPAAQAASLVPDSRAPLDYRDLVLHEFIGSGGSGKVYRAWQKSRDRQVAVKMLRKSRWSWPGAVERFLDEAGVVSRLRHPGIVGVHGVGQTPGGGCFIVMEFIAGANLAEAAAAQRPTPRQAAAWIAEAATALDFAHRSGVVHCDLKPSNLLRENTGRIVVGDFGLATSLAAPASSRQWAGTPGFMAPEQLDAAFGTIGPATDIFALGLVLHYLITGRTMFQGKRILAALSTWSAEKIDWLGIGSEGDLPAELGRVIAGCVALPPAARMPSAGALAGALREILAVA